MSRERAKSQLEEEADDDVKAIMGFGNPLLDLMTSSVEQAVLDEWGAEMGNAMLADPEKHTPLFAKLVETHPIQYVAGGATLNSIRVAQWLLSAAGKGEHTSYIGCIGMDDFGAKMKAQLAEDKVKGHFMETDEKPTGTCAVLVKDCERSLVANLAAAELYKIDHFKTVLTVPRSCQIFYCAAFPLTHPGGKETVIALGKHAVECNKTLCLNLSAPFIVMVPPLRESLLEAVKYCSYLFCNESEATALAEAMKWDAKTIPEIAKMMTTLESETRWGLTAVITQGSEATVVAKPRLPGQEEATVQSIAVKGNPWTLEKKDITDTNGAGDAFVGGFLSQLCIGAEEDQCVIMGHFAAGAIIQQPGCTCPPIESVEHVLG